MNTGKQKKAVSHHYVPQWYQRRFVDPQAHPKKLRYLDLKPDRVSRGDGTFHVRRALSLAGPAECFQTDHLYTLRFGGQSSDDLERRFFGAIDSRGSAAVDFFSNYKVSDQAVELFTPMINFLDAQKWRTPKGLDYLRKLIGRDEHQLALMMLGQMHQLHCTIWMECIWEILSADTSPTKFMVSDHPVCTYNRGQFPSSSNCTYPFDSNIELLGTHTIFPLDLNHCLVLTNLGYVRNPTASPTRVRENPHYFENTMFDLRTVQTGRQIDESWVLYINYILKSRARRYIAAAREEWLHPETRMRRVNWDKMGGRFFLMPDPRKVRFTTGKMMGFAGGGAWSADEYGRRMSRGKDADVRRLRAEEQQTFEQSKKLWDVAFGKLTPEELRKLWRP